MTKTRRRILLLVVALLAAALLDAIYVWTRTGEALSTAEHEFNLARQHLESFDFDKASDSFERAADELNSGRTAIQQPVVSFATGIPVIDDEVTALDGLIKIGTKLAESGIETANGTKELVSGGPRGTGIYERGQVDLDALMGAHSRFVAAHRTLSAANELFASLSRPRLERLQRRYDSLKKLLPAAERTIVEVEQALALLPDVLGANRQKNYLLIFQSLGEARATGGLFGFLGVLTAEDGTVSLHDIGPYTDLLLERVPPVHAPSWFRRAYQSQDALTHWPQINVSPTFPVVGRIASEMYEEATEGELDGVIAIDTIAIRDVLAAIGPVEVPSLSSLPDSVGSENVIPVVHRDSYLHLDREQQNIYLQNLISSFWERFSRGDAPLQSVAPVLSRSIRSRHLQIYLADRAAQQLSHAIGATGDLPMPKTASQMVFRNSFGANKIDYFLAQDLQTNIVVQEDDSLSVTTTISLRNQAPAGPPSDLLGVGTGGLEVGANRMTVNFLLPSAADPLSLTVESAERPLLVYRDQGHPVVWSPLTIESQAEAEVSITYQLPPTEGRSSTLVLVPQPSLRPASYEVLVRSADGSVASVSHSQAETKTTSPFRISGVLVKPERFDIRL